MGYRRGGLCGGLIRLGMGGCENGEKVDQRQLLLKGEDAFFKVRNYLLLLLLFLQYYGGYKQLNCL